MIPSPERPGLEIYWGLFLITLSTLTFEILLTRIFSVTLWYHFAFVAVSVAMFGMTVGAMLVYLAKERIARRTVRWWMSAAALPSPSRCS